MTSLLTRTRPICYIIYIVIPVLVLLSAWALWHDLGVYRSPALTRLAGPTYQRSVYATEAECTMEQRAAMAREAAGREGPSSERLVDGIKIWDPDRQHYTTLRYLCWPAGAGPAPF